MPLRASTRYKPSLLVPGISQPRRSCLGRPHTNRCGVPLAVPLPTHSTTSSVRRSGSHLQFSGLRRRRRNSFSHTPSAVLSRSPTIHHRRASGTDSPQPTFCDSKSQKLVFARLHDPVVRGSFAPFSTRRATTTSCACQSLSARLPRAFAHRAPAGSSRTACHTQCDAARITGLQARLTPVPPTAAPSDLTCGHGPNAARSPPPIVSLTQSICVTNFLNLTAVSGSPPTHHHTRTQWTLSSEQTHHPSSRHTPPPSNFRLTELPSAIISSQSEFTSC